MLMRRQVMISCLPAGQDLDASQAFNSATVVRSLTAAYATDIGGMFERGFEGDTGS